MKNIFSLSGLAILAVMSWGMIACGSDDITPEITIPTGNEDFFKKSMDFESSAAEKSLTFSSNVAWTLSVADTRDGSSWLSVNPTSGDAGTHTVTVKALENLSYDDRNAVITIVAGDTIRKVFVNQKQLDALTLTSNRFEVPVEGGSINIEVKANIDYEVIIPNDCKAWIHKANGKTRILSTSSISFTIDKCEEYDKREGKIIIKGNGKEETVAVFQAGEGILTLTKNEYNLSNSAQKISVEINSNFDYNVELPNVDWIKEVAATTRGISTHTLKLSIAENETYDLRSAKIRIYDRNSSISEELTINQGQKNAIIIDKKDFEFDEKGGSFSVEVKSNVNYKVDKTCDWITETTAATRGLMASNHSFNVSAFTDNNDREGTILFFDVITGITEKIVVKQRRALFFNSNTLTITEGANKKMEITNRTNQIITWESSNPSVASIDNTGLIKAIGKGITTITATTADGLHNCQCVVTVKDITDCVSMMRTGTSTSISTWGSRYSVTFKITNSSSETIHIVSLAGVTDGVGQDLKGGQSIEITIASSTAAIQNYQQTLIYTYNGKQYSLKC